MSSLKAQWAAKGLEISEPGSRRINGSWGNNWERKLQWLLLDLRRTQPWAFQQVFFLFHILEAILKQTPRQRFMKCMKSNNLIFSSNVIWLFFNEEISYFHPTLQRYEWQPVLRSLFLGTLIKCNAAIHLMERPHISLCKKTHVSDISKMLHKETVPYCNFFGSYCTGGTMVVIINCQFSPVCFSYIEKKKA